MIVVVYVLALGSNPVFLQRSDSPTQHHGAAKFAFVFMVLGLASIIQVILNICMSVAILGKALVDKTQEGIYPSISMSVKYIAVDSLNLFCEFFRFSSIFQLGAVMVGVVTSYEVVVQVLIEVFVSKKIFVGIHWASFLALATSSASYVYERVPTNQTAGVAIGLSCMAGHLICKPLAASLKKMMLDGKGKASGHWSVLLIIGALSKGILAFAAGLAMLAASNESVGSMWKVDKYILIMIPMTSIRLYLSDVLLKTVGPTAKSVAKNATLPCTVAMAAALGVTPFSVEDALPITVIMCTVWTSGRTTRVLQCMYIHGRNDTLEVLREQIRNREGLESEIEV